MTYTDDEFKGLFQDLRLDVRVGFTRVDEKLEKLMENDLRIQRTLDDHEHRIRDIEKTKSDRISASVKSGLISAVVAISIFAASLFVK